MSTCQGHHVKQQNAYNTRYSQAVSHPSTNRALCCLTSVIGREPVYSAWYGRRQRTSLLNLFKSKQWRHHLNFFFFLFFLLPEMRPQRVWNGVYSSFRCSWLFPRQWPTEWRNGFSLNTNQETLQMELLLNYIEVLITPELNFYALFRSGLGDEEYIKMTS